MDSDGEHLAERAVELLSAARRLADATVDPSTATHLAAALTRVGEALEALGLGFERAAAGWPRAHGHEGRSYERQAQLLSLYEAGATLRVSRRACARANELLVDASSPIDPAEHHG